MLRVYNYMAIGVAITGVVAYADLCHVCRDRQRRRDLGLTPFGNFMFASAFKWVVIFAPLGHGVLHLRAHQFDEPVGAAQIAFWVFAALDGAFDLLDLPGLCPCEHRAGVLHQRGLVRRA